MLRGQRVPTVKYEVYIQFYLFTGMSRFTVQLAIVYGVNLFIMPGMQLVVYTESLLSNQSFTVFRHD